MKKPVVGTEKFIEDFTRLGGTLPPSQLDKRMSVRLADELSRGAFGVKDLIEKMEAKGANAAQVLADGMLDEVAGMSGRMTNTAIAQAMKEGFDSPAGAFFKMKNDPRITSVGKFLRITSLDELPQFWNVLKGEMSLVGTRPPTPDEVAQYENWHRRRISIRPGITGLWQVSGRSKIEDFDEVVKLDLQYIDNWSLGLDLRILLKTVWVVITRKGSS